MRLHAYVMRARSRSLTQSKISLARLSPYRHRLQQNKGTHHYLIRLRHALRAMHVSVRVDVRTGYTVRLRSVLLVRVDSYTELKTL